MSFLIIIIIITITIIIIIIIIIMKCWVKSVVKKKKEKKKGNSKKTFPKFYIPNKSSQIAFTQRQEHHNITYTSLIGELEFELSFPHC